MSEFEVNVFVNWDPTVGLKATLEGVERSCIQQALAHHNGNRVKAAATLGCTREGLWRKMKRLGLHG